MTIFISHDNCYTVNRFLKDCGRIFRQDIHFIFYADLAYRKTLPNDIALFTDLERLDETQVELAIAAENQLKTAGVSVVNSPSQVLRRYDLLQALYQEGINPFRAYYIDEGRALMQFPVFLRMEREHQGSLSPLLHNSKEIEVAIAAAMKAGHRRDNLLLVEFCDVRDQNGLYRKYSSFKVGTLCMPRHLMASSEWMSKGVTNDHESDPECLRQERAFLRDFPHEKAIRDIFNLAKIEYGRIDYSLQDDQIRVWEINTNPNIIPEIPDSPLRQADQEQSHQNICRGFEELIIVPRPSSQIPFHIPSDLKEKLQISSVGCALHAIHRTLRPVRPERVNRFIRNKVLKLK